MRRAAVRCIAWGLVAGVVSAGAMARAEGPTDPTAAAPLVALPDDDSPETVIFERSFRGAGV